MLIRKSHATESSLATDNTQDVYELVIASFGQKPRPQAEENRSVYDPYFAFQFVNGLGLSDFQWHQLLPGVLNHHYANSVSHEAAELIASGVVRVYKMPSIKASGAIPFDEKSCYQFFPSIVQEYATGVHQLEKFDSAEKAKSFVSGIKWSGSSLARVAKDLRMSETIQEKIIKNGSNNLDFGKQEIIKFLSEGKAVVLRVEKIAASPSKEAAAELLPLRTNDRPPSLAPES
jgi:hypothetical protein